MRRTQMKKVLTIGAPIGLLLCAFFACDIQSYVLNKDSTECKQECNEDLQYRRTLCGSKYDEDSERQICHDDAYDRYTRCLKTCE